MVSGILLKSLVYFQSVFIGNVIWGSKFHSPAYNYLVSPVLLIEQITLFLLSILHFFFSNIFSFTYEGSFHGSQSFPLVCMPIFIPITFLKNYYSFVVQFEIRKHDSFSFVVFLKITLAIQNLLCFLTDSNNILEKKINNFD